MDVVSVPNAIEHPLQLVVDFFLVLGLQFLDGSDLLDKVLHFLFVIFLLLLFVNFRLFLRSCCLLLLLIFCFLLVFFIFFLVIRLFLLGLCIVFLFGILFLLLILFLFGILLLLLIFFLLFVLLVFIFKIMNIFIANFEILLWLLRAALVVFDIVAIVEVQALLVLRVDALTFTNEFERQVAAVSVVWMTAACVALLANIALLFLVRSSCILLAAKLLRFGANCHDVVVIVLAEVALDVRIVCLLVELAEDLRSILDALIDSQHFQVIDFELVRDGVRLRICDGVLVHVVAVCLLEVVYSKVFHKITNRQLLIQFWRRVTYLPAAAQVATKVTQLLIESRIVEVVGYSIICLRLVLVVDGVAIDGVDEWLLLETISFVAAHCLCDSQIFFF